MFDQGSRCAICGIPTYVLATFRLRGWPWFLGLRHGAGAHPRLTLDHLDPGRESGGFRLLCYACNALRGARRFSDEEVLRDVREKWLWYTSPRLLWWLNETPGVGGRLHRTPHCSRREENYPMGARDEAV